MPPSPSLWKLFFASLVGGAALAVWNRKRGKTRIGHGKDSAHAKFMTMLPTLKRSYVPPIWAASSHAQIGLYLLRSWYKWLQLQLGWLKIHREIFTHSDGQDVALDWFGRGPPTDGRPVMICCHGITGDTNAMLGLMEVASQRGIAAVTYNRRGHGAMALKTPKVHLFGCDLDLHEVVCHIADAVPTSPLILCGLSAGSALTVRYVSQRRLPVCPAVVGAIAVSPAYDTDICIGRATPAYQILLNKMLKDFFLEQHKEILSPLAGYAECARATSAKEFLDHSWKLGGYQSREEWAEMENPVRAARNLLTSPKAEDRSFGVPLLVLNAHDDPVSVSQNVVENRGMFLHSEPPLGPAPAELEAQEYKEEEEQMTTRSESTANTGQGAQVSGKPHRNPAHKNIRILVETQGGSHCAWFEGWFGQRSWLDDVVCDFVGACCAPSTSITKQ